MTSHDCCVALPHGAIGLSAVFNCGVSCSYSFTILDHPYKVKFVLYSLCLFVCLFERNKVFSQ